ncbi:MAG: Uncharacterised protein [Flavobacteriaceae bacterium]|nr:MAG: Uncharacterised protein [Flavobacteriaceae bacterium]
MTIGATYVIVVASPVIKMRVVVYTSHQVAKTVIKSLLVGTLFWLISQVPFANQISIITIFLKHFRHGEFGWGKSRFTTQILPCISRYSRPLRGFACQQRGTGRRANGRRIKLGKGSPTQHEFVHVGSHQVFSAQNIYIQSCLVICVYDDDIGFFLCENKVGIQAKYCC